MMIPDILSTSLLCLGVWVVWKAIKKLIFVSDLDNIPGPPSDSYLKGKYCLNLSGYVAINSSQAIFTVCLGIMLRIFTKRCLKLVRDADKISIATLFFSSRRTCCKYQVSFWGNYNRPLRSVVLVLKRG